MVILLVPVVVALVGGSRGRSSSSIYPILVPYCGSIGPLLNIFVVVVLIPYCGFVQLFQIPLYISIILMLFHHILGEEGFREGRAFEGAGGCQRCNKKIS